MAGSSRLHLLPLLLLLVVSSHVSRATEESHAGGGGGGGAAGEEGERLNSEVHVAKLELERVLVPLIITLFVMVVVLAKMGWHHHFMTLVSSNIPESCMLIVLGAHIGGIIQGIYYLEDPSIRGEATALIRFTPNLFFLYLLPPIVLEAGYFLDNRAFFENLTTILVYAVIGTLWNAFALGFILFGLFHGGVLLNFDTSGEPIQFTISAALLFGTICAAVDPVAVLAVFDEIHVNRLLHVLVFGESLLNDAVTIVLFQVLGAFANRPFDPEVNDRSVVGNAFLALAQFVVVVVASILIGLVVGMVASFITRFSEHVHVLEPMIIFAMGYLSYILADLFEFSGIISIITCAIIMKHYVQANISRKSHTTIKYSLKVLSAVSESIIFLFLGISLYESDVHTWDTGLVFWTLLFALILRPIGVICLTMFMNIFRVHKIDYKAIFVMSYSGLRGAVAFSLAYARVIEIGGNSSVPESERQLRESMLTAVTVLVLFTVFIQGTTIKPLVRRMRVRTATEEKPTLNQVIHKTSIDHVMSGIEDVIGHLGHNRLREWVQRIDATILRRIFERYPEAVDEQILHTFQRLQHKESSEAAEMNLVFEYHSSSGQDTKEGSHISLVDEDELEKQARSSLAGRESVASASEEHCVPALDAVLQASFINPNEFHRSHTLSRVEQSIGRDHRLEPVRQRRSMLQQKMKERKAHQRRKGRLSKLMKSVSSISLGEIPEYSEEGTGEGNVQGVAEGGGAEVGGAEAGTAATIELPMRTGKDTILTSIETHV